MSKLDMQETKRYQEEGMEYCHIQAEYHFIQLEQIPEEWHIQQLRAEGSNSQLEQSSQMYLQLLQTLIN